MGKTLGRSGSLIIGDGWKKVYGKVSGRANVDGTQALKKKLAHQERGHAPLGACEGLGWRRKK